MKSGLAKRLPLLLMGFVLMASSGTALADSVNRPYLKTYGGDVMTGGWFATGTNCSTGAGTDYQNPRYKSVSFAGDDRTGGILTYTKSSGNASGGASSQYGALSLGAIDDKLPGSGFYSQGAQPGNPVKSLTFANDNAALMFGGKFEGSTDQGHCIPDYFGQINPANVDASHKFDDKNNWRNAFNSNSAGSGGIYYDGTVPAGTSLNLFNKSGAGDMNLRAGKELVIAVKGNVYIDHNITYDSGSAVDNVPKFELVVQGSIYVDPGVTRLDGVYIAQPIDNTTASVSADTGVFWSCHPQSVSTDIYYPPGCTNPLVINGAIIAKQANLWRVRGDFNSASTNEDAMTNPNCGYAVINNTAVSSPACSNISEIVNYSPFMVMGGGFLDTNINTTNSSNVTEPLKIDSIISLPPVF